MMFSRITVSCLCSCFFILSSCLFFFFFFNDTATTEIYTLSLHDALPICPDIHLVGIRSYNVHLYSGCIMGILAARSEEHTSELQSHLNLVCRLLLEKKKQKISTSHIEQSSRRVTCEQRIPRHRVRGHSKL